MKIEDLRFKIEVPIAIGRRLEDPFGSFFMGSVLKNALEMHMLFLVFIFDYRASKGLLPYEDTGRGVSGQQLTANRFTEGILSLYIHIMAKASSLTPLEVKIIKLICRQLTTREIADKLGLGTRTVEGYRLIIQRKVKAKNVVGIALYAIRQGIVTV